MHYYLNDLRRTAIKETKGFLISAKTTAWFTTREFDPLYIRVAPRFEFEGEFTIVFEIAQIVVRPQFEGLGYFSRYLRQALSFAKIAGFRLVVECVYSKKLQEILSAKGIIESRSNYELSNELKIFHKSERGLFYSSEYRKKWGEMWENSGQLKMRKARFLVGLQN